MLFPPFLVNIVINLRAPRQKEETKRVQTEKIKLYPF